VGHAWIDGRDFTVVFVAATGGITEVIHEDREVFHLKVDDLDASDLEEKVAEALKRAGIRYD